MPPVLFMKFVSTRYFTSLSPFPKFHFVLIVAMYILSILSILSILIDYIILDTQTSVHVGRSSQNLEKKCPSPFEYLKVVSTADKSHSTVER